MNLARALKDREVLDEGLQDRGSVTNNFPDTQSFTLAMHMPTFAFLVILLQ